jgi:peptidyl-prolyl cis-trans isomerase C
MKFRVTNLLLIVACTTALAAGIAAADEKAATTPAEKNAATEIQTGPAATVNGIAIPVIDLERATNSMIAQNQIPPQAMTPDLSKQLKEAALNQLIGAELLYQEGKKHPVKDLDKQVDARLEQYKSRIPNKTDFDKALKSAGITMDELKTITAKEVTVTHLIDAELKDKATVSDQEAQKFYDENKDKFETSESVRASHILIGVDQEAAEADKKKAREKAETILKEVKSGKDFAELAKKDSTCPSSAQGGDLGYFGKGQMVKPFEDAALALKPGEISGIVETQFGFHIIKLTDKKPATTVTFSEAKDKIVDYLKRQKLEKLIGEYVDGLKKNAKIEVLYKF